MFDLLQLNQKDCVGFSDPNFLFKSACFESLRTLCSVTPSCLCFQPCEKLGEWNETVSSVELWVQTLFAAGDVWTSLFALSRSLLLSLNPSLLSPSHIYSGLLVRKVRLLFPCCCTGMLHRNTLICRTWNWSETKLSHILRYFNRVTHTLS